MMIRFKKVEARVNALLIFNLLVGTILFLAGCGGSNNIPPVSILTSGRITLSWNDIPGAASYDMYMSATPGVTTLNSYKISDVTSPITITDLEPDSTYYFVLVVYNDSREGRKSKETSYTVAETEGFIEFGDILAKSEPDDITSQTAKIPVSPPPEAKKAAQKPKPQVLAAPKKKVGSEIIICFGDSLTAGTGAGRGMDYPSQLAGMIGKPIINKGIPGDTTASARRRLTRDVLSAKPDMVLITLGGNDWKNGVSKNVAFGNLKYIVETIQEGGAKVIIGGLKFSGMDGGFGKGYGDLARQTGAILIPDILADIVDNPNLMSDPIHPNKDGYRIFAQRFRKALVSTKKTSQTIAKKSGQIVTSKPDQAATTKTEPAVTRKAAPAAATESDQAVRSSVPKTRDVTLAWDDVPNATAYNIYWSEKPGVTKLNGNKIANIRNPYKMKDLIIGKNYYFVVTAVNQSVEGSESGEFSFIPAQATTTKTEPAVTRKAEPAAATKTDQAVRSSVQKTRDVTLAWNDVPNAISYNIYWSETPGVTKLNGNKIANIKNPYKIKDLTIGETYYFVVTAVNQSVESSESEEFSYTVEP